MMIMAQQKQFTLEDLIPGGINYRNMVSKTLNLWWDGNTLKDKDVEAPQEGYPKVFSRDHNIFVQTSVGNESQQVTKDGCREIVYGEAVHRNEFGIDSGIFLSPDKRQFAFYRMDQSMVADYPQVNTFQREASYEPDKYPMAGMTSHKVTVGIYTIQSGKTLYLDLGDVTDRYFTNITWAPDGRHLYLIELNRDQTDATLDEYDAVTGRKVRTIISEHHDKYVHPLHPITFLPWDDSRFIYWSQRDGYWHLYLYDIQGTMLRELTPGPYVVHEIVGFCRKTQSIIITSTEIHPTQSNIYSVRLDNAKRTLLDNGKGWHGAILSPDGTHLLDTYSTPDTPRTYETMNVLTGKRKVYFQNEDPWKDYAVPQYSMGTLKAADGTTDLYYRMVLPPDFDATRKYPAIVYVYGGPQAQLVQAMWHWAARGWETYMAQKGYVIFCLDSRGSDNRGRDFEQVTFRQLGQEEMRDQRCGVDYLLSLPYIDGNRLGVHGWSYGGFMTTSLVTQYPDIFKAAVAGGAVIDWKWYEVMYGERYMDTPESNPEGYARTSLLDKAKNLRTPLLMVTGMNDPVVVPQHTLQFINACSDARTYPDLYVYPGHGHHVSGKQAIALYERISRYFFDHLENK